MKTLNKIRIRLAIWFATVVIVIYAVGAFASLFVFQTGLTRSIDISLIELLSEIRPSVQIVNRQPSLEKWANQSSAKDNPILTTVQLYDQQGFLKEHYGPEGVEKLVNGTLQENETKKAFNMRSMNNAILVNGDKVGYLQIQVSTLAQDKAVKQFGTAVLGIAPLLALGVGVAAYIFSGSIVSPIERSNRLLRRFVEDAGHELNTPVATIEGCLQTLGEPSKIGDMSEEIFDMLERASTRLRHLSKDLVSLARVEDLESELSRTSFNLKDLTDSVIAELSSSSSKKEIALHMGAFPDVSIIAHEESIHEILNNLIDNGIKYSEVGGKIDISARQIDQSISITVSDSGEGISKEDKEHIFDRFYRVDKSRSRSIGGSGLGLSIVKSAVERHKGQIFLETEPGKGSVFTVILPLK